MCWSSPVRIPVGPPNRVPSTDLSSGGVASVAIPVHLAGTPWLTGSCLAACRPRQRLEGSSVSLGEMCDAPANDHRCQTFDVVRQILSVKVFAAAPVPPPTPLASAAGIRAMATVELLDVVVSGGYAGPAWQELARRLVSRAFPDLERAIGSGAIYGRCARVGVRIPRRVALQSHPYPEDIAAEAVEDCLDRFRTRVLPEGQWDPDQGSILEDFFAACCLLDVANRWRWHLRRLPDYSVPLEVVGEGQILTLPVGLAPDPAETVENRDLVSVALAPMAPADQIAFTLLADGWSPEEIARSLSIERGALYARMSRARTASRARRTL
jgi:hypothetical protein